MSNSTIPLETIAAYRTTHYHVANSTPFALEIGRPSQPLQHLFSEYDVNSAAFLTAWNPFSQPTTEVENWTAQARLECNLSQDLLPVFAGVGKDPSGEWPGEPSILVLGLTLEAASSLGIQYQQNAIVWADQDANPQLNLRRCSARTILQRLGLEPAKNPEETLVGLIEAQTREITLPDACVVVPTKASHPNPWTDPLTVLAIITKSSGKVWLRSKTPRLTVLRRTTAVSLLAPPTFILPLEGQSS